jgi:hypothetical protein
MSATSRIGARALVLAIWLFGCAPAWCVNTLLSGMFDGSEPTMDVINNYGVTCDTNRSGYRRTAFHVAASGDYELNDALDNLWRYGVVGVYAHVYEGSFNPQTPTQNLISPRGYWEYSFTAGVTYVLVVRQPCKTAEAAWAIWFAGPGSVSSANTATVPTFTTGRFAATDPKMISDCSGGANTAFHQSEPIRVSRSGSYYFSDTSMKSSVLVCLQVYTAPLDPDNPMANRVGLVRLGDQRISLQAGQDYYFVSQSVGGQEWGEFLFVLAPPALFRINPGLSGSWQNPNTPGQGFFLTVFENINQVSLAWFSYAIDVPDDQNSSQSWLTALGPFSGTSAELAIEWTTGGAFNSPDPTVQQHINGTIQLNFTDCNSGQITYRMDSDAFGSPAVAGEIPIRRLANDSVALCESVYAGPGMPGPL